MRSCPGKTGATVLDHAGNHHTHGAVTDEIDYTLDGKNTVAHRASRNCPDCFAVFTGTVCPECGWTAEPEPPSVPSTETGELARFRAADPAETYAALVSEASARGYKLGWARLRFKDRFGKWPRKMRDVEAAYRCGGHEAETVTYGPRRVRRCKLCLAEV
jgi:hypothetical protein